MSSPTPDRPGPSPEAGEAADLGTGPTQPLRLITAHRLFFGPEGLRALWGLLFFFVVYKALYYCVMPIAVGFIAPSALAAEEIPPPVVYITEFAALCCVFLTTASMAWLEGRSLSIYGFGRRHSLRNFVAGLGWGLALLSLLVAILHATGLLVFDRRLLSGVAVLHFGALWLGGFLLVALKEEMYSRGYLQFTLTRCFAPIYRWFAGARRPELLGFWTAALILSVGFSYSHTANPGESPLGLLSAGLIGLVFCLSLWRTGSLWWAIGFHASWDWAQSYIYGVADSGTLIQGRLFSTHPAGRPILSGGLTGPEGSAYLLPIVFAATAAVLLTLPRTRSESPFGHPPVNTPGESLH
jgi:membrane protease YdiL (CAAX protease family)